MAASIHRPVLCSFLYPRVTRSNLPLAIRSFSSTSRRADTRSPGKPPASQALSVQQRIATKNSFLNASQQPDMGVLPETLVMPTGPRLPSILSEPRRRTKLEWLRLKRRLVDFFSVMMYKFGIVKGSRSRPVIAFRETKTVARMLHHDMYTALAAGDEPMLYKVCAKGLFNSFSTKVHQRPRGERFEWKVERYIGSPKVVSHRVAMLPKPFPDQSTLRQAVVRIRSRQVLDKITGNSKQEVSAKDMDEYLVLQKLMIEGKEGDWVVWGTTQESDPEMLLRDETEDTESAS